MSGEDNSLLARMRELDDSVDVDVTSEEADFIEIVCFQQDEPLTKHQKVLARKLLHKYKF